MRYRFDQYELDTHLYILCRLSTPVPMRPKVFQTLLYLLENRDRVVSSNELGTKIWAGTTFDHRVIQNCISQVRQAVGDDGRTQRIIETVRGRGYRFQALVTVCEDEPDPSEPAMETSSRQPAELPVGSSGEKRWMTVMVCQIHVVGSANHFDSEAWSKMMHIARERCAAVIHDFGGYIAQYLSYGLIVYFGYPQVYESDPERAVAAACRLVKTIPALKMHLGRSKGVELTTRVGIHTGDIIWNSVRYGNRYEILAMGHTLAVAAELQGHAAPDTVLASEVTARLVDGGFVYQAEAITVRNEYAESLKVYNILYKISPQRGYEATVTKAMSTFVGRGDEVGHLRRRWQQATHGDGQVVLLSGEAGIGKSRLVRALCEQLDHETTVQIICRSSSFHQQSEFFPAIEYIRYVFRWHRNHTVEKRARLLETGLKRTGLKQEEAVPLLAKLLSLPHPAYDFSSPLSPQLQKQKTLEVLLAWLLKIAESRPLLVVLEDVHWADPSTLEFLSLLVKHVPRARLMLLLTFRPDFRFSCQQFSYLNYMMLARLSTQQVEAMIHDVAGGKFLPPALRRQIVTKADGIPLFVEELTRMVLESNLIVEREDQYELIGSLPDLTIPATLHGVLMARLDKLGDAKVVAQLGAVIGRELSYDLLQSIAEMDETALRTAINLLVNAELLYVLPTSEEHYQFKHILVQKAAYQSMRPQRCGAFIIVRLPI